MEKRLFGAIDSVQKKSRLATTAMLILMMVCTGIGLSQVAQRLIVSAPFFILPILCGLVSLEAFYAYTRVQDMETGEKVLFRISEWVTIAVILALLLYLVKGPGWLIEDITRLNFERLEVDYHYSVFLFVMIAIWALSFLLASELNKLQVDEDEAFMENAFILETDRQDSRKRMVELMIMIGAGNILMAFLARLGLTQIPGISPGVQGPVINVLIYFFLVILFLSQTQFDYLRGHWLRGKAPVSPRLARSWLTYSLIFFAAVLLISAILPTRYSIGLLQILQMGFNLVSSVLLGLFFLIVSPILRLLAWLFSFIRQEEILIEQPLLDPAVIPPPETPATGAEWWELLKSILFWSIFLAIIIVFVLHYLRQNKALWDRIIHFKLFRWIGGVWRSLWQFARRSAQRAAEGLRLGRDLLFRSSRLSGDQTGEDGAFNSTFSPRQQIISLYISLIKKSGQKGVRRKQAQTPYQYQATLKDAIPDAQEELEGMTEAFVEARYSRHEIRPEKAGFIQQIWKRLVDALGTLRT